MSFNRVSSARIQGQARQSDDRIHGGADLVAHVGQEGGLGLIGGIRHLAGLLQLPGALLDQVFQMLVVLGQVLLRLQLTAQPLAGNGGYAQENAANPESGKPVPADVSMPVAQVVLLRNGGQYEQGQLPHPAKAVDAFGLVRRAHFVVAALLLPCGHPFQHRMLGHSHPHIGFQTGVAGQQAHLLVAQQHGAMGPQVQGGVEAVEQFQPDHGQDLPRPASIGIEYRPAQDDEPVALCSGLQGGRNAQSGQLLRGLLRKL